MTKNILLLDGPDALKGKYFSATPDEAGEFSIFYTIMPPLSLKFAIATAVFKPPPTYRATYRLTDNESSAANFVDYDNPSLPSRQDMKPADRRNRDSLN